MSSWAFKLFSVMFIITALGCSKSKPRRTDSNAPVNLNKEFITGLTGALLDISMAASDNVAVTGYYLSEVSNTPDSSSTGWIEVTPAKAYIYDFTFQVSEGSPDETVSRQVYLWFRDAAGNVSETSSDSIDLSPTDMTPPQNLTRDFINSGAFFVGNSTVTLTLAASDNRAVTGYIATEDPATPMLDNRGWISIDPVAQYSENVDFKLKPGVPGASENRMISVWFRDAAGNISNLSRNSALFQMDESFDDNIPTITGPSLISDTTTESRDVVIHITAEDDTGVFGYYISESSELPGINDPAWINVTPADPALSIDVTYTLQDQYQSLSSATVYVWVMDENGNISGVMSDTILVTIEDIIPPSGSVLINSGDLLTNNNIVQLYIQATDDTGVFGYYISKSNQAPLLSNSGWSSVNQLTTFAVTVDYEFSIGVPGIQEGRTVYVWFADSAGNISQVTSDDIILNTIDVDAPVVSVLDFINDGAATVSSSEIFIHLVATDNLGIVRYFISETDLLPVDEDAGWVDIASVTALDELVPFVFENTILGNNIKNIYILIVDKAGNVKQVNDTITVNIVDLEAPVNNSVDFINFGELSTGYRTVDINIKGTDNAGITGYYISEDSIAPLIDDSGWKILDSNITYNSTVEYIMNAEPAGSTVVKTLYLWIRDAAGNISFAATDTINYSTFPVLDVAAGFRHSLAITSNNIIYGWGDNASGQLGNSQIVSTPEPIIVSEVVPFAQVEGGGQANSIAVDTFGGVWTVGNNLFGQLGDGSNQESSSMVQIISSGILQAAGGDFHMLALKSDGTVLSWGRNSNGQLGNDSNSSSNVPVVVSGLSGIISIVAKGRHSLALKDDGSVWTWGSNLYGQLGDGSKIDRQSPVKLTGVDNVTAIASGLFHSLAVKNDGSLWSWGWNVRGQLGNGTLVDTSSPVQVSGIDNVVGACAGEYHSLALKADGTLWAWGWNEYGQLGDGSNIDKLTPVQVTGLTNVEKFDCGWWHNIALKDESVWTWGSNSLGALGVDVVESSSIPVRINLF